MDFVSMSRSEFGIYGTISMRNLSKLHIHAQMSFHLHSIFHAAERRWSGVQSRVKWEEWSQKSRFILSQFSDPEGKGNLLILT